VTSKVFAQLFSWGIDSVVPLTPNGLRAFAKFTGDLSKLPGNLWQLFWAKEQQRYEKYHHKF
jgi:hypothetical protein